MSKIEDLMKLIGEVGREHIYRPIYDHKSNLLVEGTDPARDELVIDFSKINFQGKSVLDLGCNFGFFSFLAQRLGASRVLGVDNMPEIIEGCRLLTSIYGLSNVEFKVADLECLKLGDEQFDIVLLFEYIGKASLKKNKFRALLSTIESFSRKKLLLVISPIYTIQEELKTDPGELARHYSDKYMTKEHFELYSYIKEHLAQNWVMQPISAIPQTYRGEKKLIQFVRRTGR
jgi:SAM-dependent methyltransferase